VQAATALVSRAESMAGNPALAGGFALFRRGGSQPPNFVAINGTLARQLEG
jgi:hypothetical protein